MSGRPACPPVARREPRTLRVHAAATGRRRPRLVPQPASPDRGRLVHVAGLSPHERVLCRGRGPSGRCAGASGLSRLRDVRGAQPRIAGGEPRRGVLVRPPDDAALAVDVLSVAPAGSGRTERIPCPVGKARSDRIKAIAAPTAFAPSPRTWRASRFSPPRCSRGCIG